LRRRRLALALPRFGAGAWCAGAGRPRQTQHGSDEPLAGAGGAWIGGGQCLQVLRCELR